jgi:phosphate transport system protein
MDKENQSRHISKQFDQELEEIRNRVLAMGGLVEQQLAKAVLALVEPDIEMAEEVIRDDYKVNALEVELDEECTTVLARRQPAARDLRLVISVIKTITDLERIGDEAKRIARQAIDLASQPTKKNQFIDLERLGQHVCRMLHDALDAFARLDVEQALDVAIEDQKVDQEYDGLMRQQMTYLIEDPRTIPATLDIMWSARALERVGDRSCNICEYVIYQVKGKDIRHISIEQVEKDFRRKP